MPYAQCKRLKKTEVLLGGYTSKPTRPSGGRPPGGGDARVS